MEMGTRLRLLTGSTVAAIVVSCGCSNSTEENRVQKADDSGKQQSAAQFVKAKITRYDSLEENIADRKMETRTIVITDAKKVNRLASFFPGLGEHRESPRGNGWEKFADIWFFRDDGNSMRLSVDPALDTWAEGKGAWPVRSPKEFQAYFRTLFAEHEKK